MTNLQNLAVWSTKIQSEARLVGRCRQRGCVFGWKSIISSLPRGLCCFIHVLIHFHDDFTNPNCCGPSKKAFGDSIPPTDQVLTRGMERRQAEAGLPRRFFCSNGALVSNSIKLTRKTDMNSFIIDKAPQPIAPRCPLICLQLKKTPRFVRTDCARRGRESLRLVPRALTLSIL